jgi:uncharacterized protein
VLDAIIERGMEHERRYVEHLREQGRAVVELTREDGAVRAREEMERGADVIVQATLAEGQWLGIADVLLRVETPSDLGNWSYEVLDTKLARETAGGTILQLCLYSELVEGIQGTLPRETHVVAPGNDFVPSSYRVLDYLAYYRWVKRRLEKFVEANHPSSSTDTYPEPTGHCDICNFRPLCNDRRRQDDHLSLVAGILKLQRAELVSREIETLATLAVVPLPIEWKPDRGSPESYRRVREQARVQLEARTTGKPVFELLEREEGRGFLRLPEPSPLDVFFDIEGDSFAEDGGREYLFGYALAKESGETGYKSRWAYSLAGEKAMFEAFIAEMMERWTADPDFHIYHYAPYEPSTLKRLMGRHATCEEEIDRMLRAGVFVDLYRVAREAVLAGIESYSIKQLEPLFGFEREEDLREVRAHLSTVERALELGEIDEVPQEVLDAVETYNRDDCVATLRLRDWLESLRDEVVATGEEVPRPVFEDGEPNEELSERQQRFRDLAGELTAGLPEDREAWSDEQQALHRLANLLEWHWREDKVSWWEFYRLVDLDAEELLDEREAISGLVFEGVQEGGTARCPIHRYSYPHQEVNIEEGDLLTEGGTEEAVGTVVAIDKVARRLDVKRRQKTKDRHPVAVFHHDHVGTTIQANSLYRFAEWVVANGLDGDGSYSAARDLLLASPPRFEAGSDGLARTGDESILEFARRVTLELQESTLAVQGPPGSGKTYSGARMISALVKRGKKVGITANSHKVIRNLLDEVVQAAKEEGIELTCVQKVGNDKEIEISDDIAEVTSNPGVLDALEAGQAQVGAGTAWLWSRPEFFESVDVLVVDEAGQMSLANTLAVAQAGKSLILLGDPQQLEQPQKGSHPEGTDLSALEHILGERDTIAADRGLFLPETWRLHPELCRFTSELFYDDRLEPRPDLANQRVVGSAFQAPGLWFAPVEHEGNQSSSPEEVEVVAGFFDELLTADSWIDREQRRRPFRQDEILIVAPYNAQVSLLSERLGSAARVGTVDKFQGQEAPIVIYSMASSSPEDAPRGMEFLYSPNRLNVASSRARCGCILVASPRLFEPECRTPRQMLLANAFCRYLEMAKVVA